MVCILSLLYQCAKFLTRYIGDRSDDGGWGGDDGGWGGDGGGDFGGDF